MLDKFILKIIDNIPRVIILIIFSIAASLVLILIMFGSWELDIVSLSTLFVAVAAIGQMVYTNLILKQQKKEEKIKYRAYLSITSVEVKMIEGVYDHSIIFFTANNGVTPVRNLRSRSYFMINGQIEGERGFEESPVSYINPSNISNIGVEMGSDSLGGIVKGSQNYFVMEILYNDYKGVEHKFTAQYNSLRSSDGQYSLINKEHFENY